MMQLLHYFKFLIPPTLSIFFVGFSSAFAQTQPQNQPKTQPQFESQTQRSSRTELTTSYRTVGAQFDEGPDQSDFVQFALNLNLKHNLFSDLDIKGRGSLNLVSGRIQTRFENPNNEIVFLQELILHYHPMESFQIKAGAISQDHFNAANFLFERAFPGVQLLSQKTWDKISVAFKGQYTIPNSTSLEFDRVGREETPTLSSAGLELNWKPIKNFKISSQWNYFSFQDLPSVVAFDSSRRGNQVFGETQSESVFAFEFTGLAQSHEILWSYNSKLKQSFSGVIVENMEAPSDRRRAQMIKTEFGYDFGDWVILPNASYFFSESDSIPAIYADAALGGTNREGFSYGVKANFKKLKFSVSAQYVDANLIEAHPVQRDLDVIQIFLEVANVTF